MIHSQVQKNQTCSYTILILLLVLSLQATMSYAANAQVDALLKLKQSLSNATALSSWDPRVTPCSEIETNWVGLICSQDGVVFGLRLENMGLSGKIDMDALSGLPELRTLNVMNNNLEGPMPNLKSLMGLRSIELSNNYFGGEIEPQVFVGLDRLKKILLANNKFTGPIPISLTKLPELSELRLEGNQFQGRIPDFPSTTFVDFNVANNRLEGPIPSHLLGIGPPAFAGNKGLCGAPLGPCTGPSPEENAPSMPRTVLPPPSEGQSPPPPRGNSTLLAIIIAIIIILLVILLVIAMICRKRKTETKPLMSPSQVVDIQPKKTAPRATKGDAGKLCFVKDNGEKFDLSDLLKASAAILGRGSLGSSFKASLPNGSIMVVKRSKQMGNVGSEEFQEHMTRIGRLEHKNVVALVAFYYRKEEKLLVSKFVEKGSLASHLYGSHAQEQPKLDWPTRLNIIKGVARGLSYLYKELSHLITPHGHLKSSNVLLDDSFTPLIHDYGIIPLINQETAQQLMVVYKAPEYVTERRINKKTDVWSLGILIIEVMTGQFPSQLMKQGNDVDLSSWIKEVVGDVEGRQVFDQNMDLTPHNEGEMHKMLKIGVACCEEDARKRWDIDEACARIEEVKERDNDDDFYSVSSYNPSEAERRSRSRGMSLDDASTFTSI